MPLSDMLYNQYSIKMLPKVYRIKVIKTNFHPYLFPWIPLIKSLKPFTPNILILK